MHKVHYVKFSTILYYLGICILISSIFFWFRLFWRDDNAVTASAVDSKQSFFTDDLLKCFVNTASPTIEVLYRKGGLLPEFDFEVSLLQYMTNINLKDPLTILKNQIPVLGFVDVEKTINQTGSTEVITEEPKRELPGKTEVEVQDNKETEEINETEAISDQPLVLVYHTHTREAYIGKYKVDDVDRTLDPEYNVIRVGEELKKELEKRGIPVIHDKTVYDVPYDNSYGRSNAGIKNILKEYPTIKYAFDVHRDAFGEVITKDTLKVPDPDEIPNKSFRQKYIMSYDGKKLARVMWVVGTRRTENQNEDWHLNYAFTKKLHEALNEKVPNLSIGVETKPYGSYNQEILPDSTLVEIGSNHNTIEEALNSVSYVADAIADVIKK